MSDAALMARALRLARRGLYTTSPNPRVGCVIARDGQAVAEGWHRKAGEGHAEVNALARLGNDASGATAYITLEPCSHHGRTPPCSEALIEAGVRRVVVAMEDPNPQVAGNGIRRLREAGIDVEVGVLESEARELNRGFIKRMQRGLPLVRIKMAMSLDGRTAMASGESQWITGADARADVQRLRAASCAVVSGVETVARDNAALTVRPKQFAPDRADEWWRQPLRVVLDSNLRTPADGRLFGGGGPILIVAAVESADRQALLEQRGAEVIYLPEDSGRVDLQALLRELARRECNEVLIEAGATLAGRLVATGLADELILYMAPTLLGSDARPLLELPIMSMAEQNRVVIRDIRAVGDDWRIQAVIPPPEAD